MEMYEMIMKPKWIVEAGDILDNESIYIDDYEGRAHLAWKQYHCGDVERVRWCMNE